MSTAHDEIRGRDTFWTRVDAALDARRDPLADEQVVAWLGERPDDAAALAELLARLDTLSERAPRPAARSRRGTHRLVLAAASLVVAFAAWAALRPLFAPAPHASVARSADEPFDPRAFRLESCTIELVTRTPESVETTRVTGGVIERSFATSRRGDSSSLATVVTHTRRTPAKETSP